MFFFALLDDSGDDRCKLRLDLHPDTHPPIVASVRTALKDELGWKAAEMMLFKLKPQVNKQFTQVTEADCVKLLDDEAECDVNLVFVKRRAPATPQTTTVPPQTPPKRRLSEEDALPARKTRRTTPAASSPPASTDAGSGSSDDPHRSRFNPVSYRRTTRTDDSNGSAPYRRDYYEDFGPPSYRRYPPDNGNYRPPSPSRYDRRSGNGSPFIPIAAPPPPPPPPASGRAAKRSLSTPRDRHMMCPAWATAAKNKVGSPPPLRGNKGKLIKADMGRQPSRPRAPVVHNLISKQLFLEELQAIISRACAGRDRQVLPYAIGSIDDICVTHELTLPMTYNWERIRTASEFQTLSSAHRALLEPPETPAMTPESADAAELDVPTFDTTICFVEVGQERLLVFDWYVYALDAVAEHRQRLEDEDEISNSNTHAKQEQPIFYIYGQPRIGKSICVLFLAIAAAYVGERIYYYCDSKVWQVSADGLARYNLQDLLRQPGASSRSPKRFLFAELRIREQEEVLNDLRAVARHLNLIVVASAVPDVRLIEERRKVAPSSEPMGFLVVPPPAFHELYALKTLVYPTISRTEFEFRYYLFGPIPRNIISETGPFGYILDGWQQQVAALGPAVAATYPNEAPAPDLLDGEPPRLALLLMPAVDAAGTPSTSVALSFVSAAAEAVFHHTA